MGDDVSDDDAAEALLASMDPCDLLPEEAEAFAVAI